MALSAAAPLASANRVVFLINSLTGGGAERVMSAVLAGLTHILPPLETHLVLLDNIERRYPVPASVRVHQLDSRGSLTRSVRQLTAKLHELKPDVVVSSLSRSNAANVLSANISRHRSVITEHTHTSTHFGGGLGGLSRKLVARLTYPLASRVVAVSSGTAEDLVENFAVRADRLRIINNPIDHARIEALAIESPTIQLPADYAVAVGRLIPTKNVDLLIKALRAGIEQQPSRDPRRRAGTSVSREAGSRAGSR